MNPLSSSYHRTLLQKEADDRALRSPASATSFTSTSPFDSSLVLTVLVLLTVLFFMAFFSLYIRRFSNINNNSGDSVSGSRQSPPHKHDGVEASTVRSLPSVPYGGDSNIWSECSICLTEFEERETVKVIPYCRHGFHPMCIEKWLSSHVSCPLCRSTQLFPAVDDEDAG